ncbi:MAG: TetR/AcrR family transcriptional regulator [Actinomycetota bacterium]|nr:TetR/AcrR family transcriptional regulator [Actinomycetota bacterium]
MTRVGSRLSADDWAQAGFEALLEEGLAGVAVERVAARLAATKGSFYWHFTNRDALVGAVLDLWSAETEGIISTVDETPDPVQRMRRIFDLVIAEIPIAHAEIDLLGNTTHPLVAQAMDQVSRRRIDYMTSTLRQAGLSPTAAADAAVHAYALWIGLLQLQLALPGTVPDGRARKRFQRATGAMLEHMLPVD